MKSSFISRSLAMLAFATAAMAQTAITTVVDAGAYTNNLAQGSVFVVRGTSLSPVGFVAATAPGYPTTLNSVRITLTPVATGPVVNALMVHTYNINNFSQAAAVVPSGAAVGDYDLRVINGTVMSPAFRTTVVARKPGIVTATSDGRGPAQATLDGKMILQRTSNLGKIGDFDSRSAHPGERVDLWGTGLGPDLASDTGGTSGDQTAAAQVKVLVNGIEVTPAYAGRSQGFPGLDQIAFTLPASTALNCRVDIQVRAGIILSNAVTIATATGDACPTDTSFRINEVESNGGVPGDWVEIYNPGPGVANLKAYTFKDNDDTHSAYPLPAVTLPVGGYITIEEADFVFGLGAPDSARIFRPDGTLADSYSWTAHATTTYGRCPNGEGALTTTTSSTKGAANDCGSPVRINEVESNGGTPGDWVELYNPGANPVDLTGYVFKDSDDTHNYTLPRGTMIAAGGYVVLEEADFVFGLGAPDAARLYDPTGALVDSYSWTDHAGVTYGRCPNGTGAFANTNASTKGAANACAGDVSFAVWPGGTAIQTVDKANTFGGNLSGLDYEGTGGTTAGVMWGVRNGPSTLYRLTFDGTNWVPDATSGWGSGKALRYPNGTGDPDAEGVTFTTASSAGIFVSTERDNNVSGTSRPAILRFDATATGSTLTATGDWNLTADLPVAGANLGLEGITWIPDTFLTSKKFFDESKNHTYDPSEYPNHGSGLFFVGLEANGNVYGYALDLTNGSGFTRLATISTGFPAVMDLSFDKELGNFWAVCDDTCQGRTVVLAIDGTTGKFTVARRFERPTGMPNLNNEGFTFTPLSYCTGGTRPVFWADDTEDDGHAIRAGTLTCSAF